MLGIDRTNENNFKINPEFFHSQNSKKAMLDYL